MDERNWHWSLPCDPRMVSTARRNVAAAVSDVDRDTVEIALLLTSEVVTNALRYGDTSSLSLSLRLRPDELLVEVDDATVQQPQVRLPRQLDERGRGLMLLDALASEWGSDAKADGKTVWFRLALTTPVIEGSPLARHP